MIVGGVVSWTVTVAVQVAVLPWPSLTVRVTVLGPMLAQVKELGLTDCGLTVPQLSDPELNTSAGVMLPVPLAFRVTVAGLQVTVGARLSTMVTVAVQVLTFPLPSLAVRVTVFPPIFAQVKEFGLTETRFTVPQLSDPELKTSAGAIEAVPAALSGTVMSLQAIEGGSLSVTVTSKLQGVLPLESVALTVMWVTPLLKEEPLPVPEPLPVVAPLKEYVKVGVPQPPLAEAV